MRLGFAGGGGEGEVEWVGACWAAAMRVMGKGHTPPAPWCEAEAEGC